MKRAQNDSHRSWPLYILAAPATVAVWSGWVGLGEKTGFGMLHPLPGIADHFSINTAITLPVGVEAYAAYALGAWLSKKPLSDTTRGFARASAIGALVLGALGQIAYHLLEVSRHTHAPIVITMLVACLPVAVLGMGATLAHLIHRDGTSEPNGIQVPAVEVRPGSTDAPNLVRPAAVRNLPAICSRSILSHPNLNQRTATLTANQRPAEPEPRPEPEPAVKANQPAQQARTSTTRTTAANLGEQAEKKAQEVRQVRNLIDELGYDEVTLTLVRNRLNHLSKTTAYQRLTAGRNLWNQEQEAAS
jgi:hypothetical protein